MDVSFNISRIIKFFWFCFLSNKIEDYFFNYRKQGINSEAPDFITGNVYCYCCKPLQSCPTLCDPIDSSPPGSAIPGILQARIVEWVAISFSNAGKWKVKVKSLSRVRLLATPWTAAHQAPPSMEFSRQEYWSGVPLPSPTSVLNTLRHHRGRRLASISMS